MTYEARKAAELFVFSHVTHRPLGPPLKVLEALPIAARTVLQSQKLTTWDHLEKIWVRWRSGLQDEKDYEIIETASPPTETQHLKMILKLEIMNLTFQKTVTKEKMFSVSRIKLFMDIIYNAGSQIHSIDGHKPWSITSHTFRSWKFAKCEVSEREILTEKL